MTNEPLDGRSHDHVCLAYDDPATLATHARAWLTAGAAAGQRTWYLGPGEPPAGTGARHVRMDTAYTAGAEFDPAAQAAVFMGAFRQALAAGFTGLSVVADVTPLVRTAARRRAFCRYEHLIDRFMAQHRLSGMCAFRRAELDDQGLAELACLHPAANVAVPFRLHACRPELGRAELAGELDINTAALLHIAMDRVALLPGPGEEVVLHAAGLRFADHRTLLRLDDWAAGRDATMVLRAAPAAVARLAGLLGLRRIRVEAG